MAEERLESVTFLLEREAHTDAIPILFKVVDTVVRTLLSFKERPLEDYQKNVKLLEEEYTKEDFCDKDTLLVFLSLLEMDESYRNELDSKFDESTVKNVFDKTEDFLAGAKKYLKNQLTTSKEIKIKRKAKKILIPTGILIASLLIIFLLIKVGMSEFGPQHGLSAYYFNNTKLREPAAVKKIDKKIDFVWGDLNPQKNIIGEFSVRWEGKIKIDKSDTYTFHIRSDEGVRLLLDDGMVINTWKKKKRERDHSGKVELNQGLHKIKLEYFFNQRHADIKLFWSSGSFNKRIVESKALYPPKAQSE